MEQLDYNLLFRWFVGLAMDAPVWDVTVFTKNRDRLLEGEIARQVPAAVLAQPEVKALLSDEHFSVDGTLIEAWASMKSFRPKDGSGEPPARRAATASATSTARSAATRRTPRPPIPMPGSTARARQGGQALLHGPSADGEPQRPDRRRRLTQATGTAEREAAAGDGGGDRRAGTGSRSAPTRLTTRPASSPTCASSTSRRTSPRTPANRRSAIDGRTTRHPGYAVSQRIRKRIEEAFGWIKTVAPARRARHRGTRGSAGCSP